MNPRPLYTREQALARMLAMVGQSIPYYLGTGDADGPTTRRDGKRGRDCAGAALCEAFGIPRHRPGFNRGRWATVSDDINTNSAIEDSEHARDLWEPVTGDALPGDVVAYPTIYVRKLTGKLLRFIGHVQMIVKVPTGWTPAHGFASLQVVHCHGPDGRVPGVTISDGGACDRHDEQWGKPQHRTKVLRIRA